MLSFGLSLFLAEALLRWVGHDDPQLYRLDPLVGWRRRAGITGWCPGEVDAYIAINHEGYREQPV